MGLTGCTIGGTVAGDTRSSFTVEEGIKGVDCGRGAMAREVRFLVEMVDQ
jgi:hypothetical protein